MKTFYSDITDIKERLDPNFGYLIFEKAVRSGQKRDFTEAMGLLDLKEGVRKRAVYLDQERDRLFLVVKVDPEQTDTIVQKFLGTALPEGISLTVYGRRPEH
jgi:hypothetical protein